MSAPDPIILVAADFEPHAKRAIELALELAGPLGAKVVLVHACEVPVYPYPGIEPVLSPGLNEQIAEAARQALHGLSALYGGLETMLRLGDPADEIVAVADELRPLMVVMGTHGRGTLARALLGSVAIRVLRKSPVPVLTVRAPEP